ncbi:Zinc finger CCHC [Mactra antiquata]
MVCKEELCTWFRDLQPHKRIDYMCGMLQMCLPMELRFMGSYVEDLAKKDFHELRESEGKANSHHELKKFSETDVRVFRTKMAVYLALLHSSNMRCSNIIFQLLENRAVDALVVNENMDVMTVYNILLVLSMAMNHPAFSYHQKTRMYEHYTNAKKAADRIHLMKVEQELLLSAETHDFRHCEQRLSPMCSPHIPTVHLIPSRVSPHPANHIHSTSCGEKVHVCHIDVKSAQTRDAEKNITEYKIQVTWSNGEKKNVFKTYQELMEFHKKLKQEFQEELLSHQQKIQLPSIKSGTQNHRKENTDLLSQYVTSLSNLPEHIRKSTFFVSFFETMLHRPEMADACTSPRPPTFTDVPVVQHLPTDEVETTEIVDQSFTNQLPTQALYSTYLSQSPINGDMCSLSPRSPAHHEMAYQEVGLSPSFSTKTTSPLMSSPCHSPVSSLESPSNSMPGSPSLHDREGTRHIQNCKEPSALLNCDENSVHNISENLSSVNLEGQGELNTESSQDLVLFNLLKASNLGQYAEHFMGYSLEHVFSLRNEDVEAMFGVPRNIAAEIKHLLRDKMKEKQPPCLNGPAEPTPPVGHIWHPCLHPQGGIPPIPYQHNIPYQHVFNYPFQDVGVGEIVAPNQELSPSNSECSSPSPSPHLLHMTAARKPHLQVGPSDSSSDDGERDKKPGQYRSSKWKGHAPNTERVAGTERSSDIKYDTNSNSGTPPLTLDKSDPSHLYSNPGGSGYTSDPTYTRPQLMRGTYKAQPAHMNIQSQSKFLINMPENSFKGGAQSFVPMVMPQQLRDMTMPSTASQPNYNMSTGSDYMGQRSMYLLHQNPHIFTRNLFGQMNMSGSRPMFPPGAMTTGLNVNQSLVQPQPSHVNGSAPSVSCSKMFHGPPVPVNMDRKPTNMAMNGVDSNVGNQPTTSESCNHRSQNSSVNNVTSSSTTVTNMSSGVTATPNPSASCSSCGCPGHSTQTQHPIPFMQHTVWPNPYSNGLLQVPAMPHPLFIQGHLPYPNGLNQDMIYGHQYGMQQAAAQGMPGVPNVMCGYNYNNQGIPSGVHNQKKPKKLNCHNCGSTKHSARDCSEVSMEAMAGQTIFRPKNDSD